MVQSFRHHDMMVGNTTQDGLYPSKIEIALPSIIFLVVAAVAMIILMLKTKRTCGWKLPTIDDNSIVPLEELARTIHSRTWNPFTHFDTSVLQSLNLFVNTPYELFKISLPAIISLLFSPLTMFIQKPILQLFWPNYTFPDHPNINDSLGCFLVPTGMVYAISFGFTFQQVMAKQQATDMYIGQEVDRLHRLITMVSKLNLHRVTTKLQIYHLIKNEAIKFILDLQDRDLPTGIPDLIDILCLICEDNVGWKERYNSTVKIPITNLVTDTPYDVGSRAPSKQRINILQWAFLEMLGYFTFLGMMLVVGHSYRIELSMCVITVLSITMLCYIIADMDSPFHGYFRTDLSSIQDLANRLEQLYAVESKKLFSTSTNV